MNFFMNMYLSEYYLFLISQFSSPLTKMMNKFLIAIHHNQRVRRFLFVIMYRVISEHKQQDIHKVILVCNYVSTDP